MSRRASNRTHVSLNDSGLTLTCEERDSHTLCGPRSCVVIRLSSFVGMRKMIHILCVVRSLTVQKTNHQAIPSSRKTPFSYRLNTKTLEETYERMKLVHDA